MITKKSLNYCSIYTNTAWPTEVTQRAFQLLPDRCQYSLADTPVLKVMSIKVESRINIYPKATTYKVLYHWSNQSQSRSPHNVKEHNSRLLSKNPFEDGI